MGRDGFAPPVCARRPAACRCRPRGAHHRGNHAVRGEIVWKVRPSMPDTAMVSGNPKRGAARRVVSGEAASLARAAEITAATLRSAARCSLGCHRKNRGGIREGAVKPGHRRHHECGGGRQARLDGGMVCRSCALRAYEPPRSKRWCQRRCDRGVWARDPGVCCADAPSLRRGAETSSASTSFGWVENTGRVAERRQGLKAVQPPSRAGIVISMAHAV